MNIEDTIRIRKATSLASLPAGESRPYRFIVLVTVYGDVGMAVPADVGKVNMFQWGGPTRLGGACCLIHLP